MMLGVAGVSPAEGVAEDGLPAGARGSRNEHGCVKFPARLSPSLLV